MKTTLPSIAALFAGLYMFACPNVGQSGIDKAAEGSLIRPFKVRVPEAELDELRHRVVATRWPDKEPVADRSQGAQLAKPKELASYWSTEYDWRKLEAKLNALPQFMTTIDGVDIYFIHVRSRFANALWP